MSHGVLSCTTVFENPKTVAQRDMRQYMLVKVVLNERPEFSLQFCVLEPDIVNTETELLFVYIFSN